MSKSRVVICCFAYNQELYIGKCLENFVNQSTNFPYHALVHDDCSTDSTKEIIKDYSRRYPDIIVPIFENENLYSKQNDSLLNAIINRIQDEEYIAFCEGDDFWTDSLKLQKQVDYLDANPECVLCHANAVVLKGDKSYQDENRYFRNDILEDLLLRDKIFTGTVVVRTKEWKTAEGKRRMLFSGVNRLPFLDHPWWVFLGLEHKIYYLNETVACYRILDESACHTNNIQKKYNYTASVARFHQTMFDYCKQYRTFSKDFTNDFYEMLFHLRKRALREAGMKIGYPQIWELIKLLPYLPMVAYRWLKRNIYGKQQ